MSRWGVVVVSILAHHAAAQSAASVIPVAAPAYTPEQGLLFAAGGVMTWNGDPEHPKLPRSSLTLIGGVSTLGSVMLQSRLNAFTHDDTVRFTALLDVRDQPDHYFGAGYLNGSTRALGDDTTRLRRTWWGFDPTMLLKVHGRLYGGVVMQLSGTIARELAPGVEADLDFRRHGQTIINTGVGVTLQYDSRDVPVSAWKGLFLAATWTGYGRGLGANTAWHALSLDYRQYVELGRPGSTLTWQVKYRATFGDVPWSDLAQVGTPLDLRAYRWGQYRDRTSGTAVVEYRFMFHFDDSTLWSSLWTRLGAAAWVGVGALGSTVVLDIMHPLPAAGIGLRIELKNRVTVRLDFGFGRDSRAVYFNFLEAF